MNKELFLYKKMINHFKDYLWSCDNSGIITYVNPQWIKTTGDDEKRILGNNFSVYLQAGEAEETEELLAKLKKGESISDYESFFKNETAPPIYLSMDMIPIFNDSGEYDGFMGIAHDITKKKQAELNLEETHQMLEKLARLVPGVIYQYRFYPDGHSSFPYSSPGMIDIYGVTPDEVREDASKVFTRILPEDVDDVARAIQISADTLTTFYSGEFRVEIPGKGIGWRWSQAHPEKLEDGSILWHGIILDITEKKEAEEVRSRYEEQLNKSQKLESLGVLAGGIAHDFNNLMGGIFGFVEVARAIAEDEKIKEYLSKALSTIDRAHALTHQLLTFARGGAPNKEVDTLFPLVQESAQFALSGSNITCCFDIAPNLGLCNFDKNQIAQVVDNIFINAKQAMPQGGVIELTARNTSLEKNEKPDLPKGEYIRISVKDSGPGISQEHLDHIFDPFFTTKSKGHGLGLATSFSIISRHNGTIEVDSTLGKGTTFHIYLPVTDLPRTEYAEEEMKTHKGSGTVLLMDDERIIRESMRGILESFGYGVITREDGKGAVEYFLSHNTKELGLKAVFLDLTVPGGMGGRETVEKIREHNKEIPVFVVSGYADDPIMIDPERFGFTASMNKPFRLAQIVEMLNRYL